MSGFCKSTATVGSHPPDLLQDFRNPTGSGLRNGGSCRNIGFGGCQYRAVLSAALRTRSVAAAPVHAPASRIELLPVTVIQTIPEIPMISEVIDSVGITFCPAATMAALQNTDDQQTQAARQYSHGHPFLSFIPVCDSIFIPTPLDVLRAGDITEAEDLSASALEIESANERAADYPWVLHGNPALR